MGLLDSIIGAESGGNATAANPNSSALGPGQFIASTWADMMKRYHPEIQGTPDQILAMRTDPDLSREMTANYATENQKTLTDNGLPVTPGNTYLAHFAGPQGAVKVLQADPGASAGSVLGDAAVRANPFLRGMTVKDLQGWADRKMGGTTIAANNAPVAAPMPNAGPSAPLNLMPAGLPPSNPIFPPAAPQQQQAQQAPAQSYWDQVPIQQAQAPPIFYAPRKTNVAMARIAPGFFNGYKA